MSITTAPMCGEPSLFKLHEGGRSAFVSGVPPDYFSRTGQLWGNPFTTGMRSGRAVMPGGVSRVRHNLKLFDLVRIDHCRGLVATGRSPQNAGRP